MSRGCSIPTGLLTIEQWRQASRCSDRLRDVRETVLRRCAAQQPSFHDSSIDVSASADHVRADLRCRRYLLDPHVEVPYLTGVAGEYLHPDLVNFDILARENYSAFKSRMLGEDTAPRRLCVEPSDDSVERLTKAQLIEALAAHISASTHGAERDDRMRELRRVSSRPKADVKELWLEVTGGVTDYCSSIDD